MNVEKNQPFFEIDLLKENLSKNPYLKELSNLIIKNREKEIERFHFSQIENDRANIKRLNEEYNSLFKNKLF